MKKILMLLLIIVFLVSATACGKKEEKSSEKSSSGATVREGIIHEHCTRTGKVDDNSSAEMSYEIYYTGEVLNRIESTERVTSTTQSVLDEYENAYRTIHSYYKDLKYYDTNIIRTDSSVTSKMSIDYDKIDLKKLIELEGEEDNIFEDGKPMISKYKDLAKKLGVKGEVVS